MCLPLATFHDSRVGKAADRVLGALLPSKLERIIIDCSYIDQKKRGIFDMRETEQPLMRLLNRPELKGRYGGGSGDIQLICY